MTTPKRQRLIDTSFIIECYANMKLELNEHKGDRWREIHYQTLLSLMATEQDEIVADVVAWEMHGTDVHGKYITEQQFRENLMKEIGDKYNFLRFLADKYGCLDVDAELRHYVSSEE